MSNVSWGAIIISIIVMVAMFGERCGGGCNGCTTTQRAQQVPYATPPQQASPAQQGARRVPAQTVAQQTVLDPTVVQGMHQRQARERAQLAAEITNITASKVKPQGTPGPDDMAITKMAESHLRGSNVVCVFLNTTDFPIPVQGGIRIVADIDKDGTVDGIHSPLYCASTDGALYINNVDQRHAVKLLFLYDSGVPEVQTGATIHKVKAQRCASTQSRRYRKTANSLAWTTC